MKTPPMKTLLNTLALALAVFIIMPLNVMTAENETTASDRTHKVVFEVTADGAEKWLGALRNVENAQKSLGGETVKFEVVTHGKGLGMLLAKNADENAELKEKLAKLHADGVVFAACENTMRRDNVEKKDLVDQATTVDSGVGEVIRKQGEGYSYIKIGG